MPENPFLKKLKNKSDSELERIAMDSDSYIFNARFAAITLLKKRNYASTVIQQVEQENYELENAKKKEAENLKQRKILLIKRLKDIPIKGNKRYALKNGTQLQIKRFNENTFQIRIEDGSRSYLAPVIICKIKNATTFSAFPFFYLKPILVYGICGSALIMFLAYLGYWEVSERWMIVLPLVVSIGIQLLSMPIIYLIVLKTLRNHFGNVLNKT